MLLRQCQVLTQRMLLRQSYALLSTADVAYGATRFSVLTNAYGGIRDPCAHTVRVCRTIALRVLSCAYAGTRPARIPRAKALQ
eukprot:440956-Rhodomonas_salina.1